MRSEVGMPRAACTTVVATVGQTSASLTTTQSTCVIRPVQTWPSLLYTFVNGQLLKTRSNILLKMKESHEGNTNQTQPRLVSVNPEQI